MTGAERKQQKYKHGGARAGSERKPREVIVPEVSSDGVHVSGHNAHLPPHPIFTATRLASTTQSESNNNPGISESNNDPGISVEINAPNRHSGSNAGNLFSDTNDSVPNSASRDQFLSESEWERLLAEQQQAKEVDPQTDGYGNYVDESVYDEVPALGNESLDDIPDSFGANEAEETMGIQTEYLATILTKLKDEIKSRNRPDCYAAGTFWIRPRDPIQYIALRASHEFADALLALIRHRRNQRVGFANRTGGTYRNHFENWTLDEIMELAAEVNFATLFPQPNLLATRIKTSEVFGIIPIPEQTTKKYDIRTATRPVIQPIIYYRDTPAHLRIHLSTAPLNAYVYLQQQQRTAHPKNSSECHPNQIQKTLILKRWHLNGTTMLIVDTPTSQGVAALLAENATLYNSEISRKEATAILTDSARYASTLPPIQLSTQISRKGKEKAIESQTDDLTTTLPFNDIEMADVFGTSPTNEDFMVEDSMETQDAHDASGSANVTIKAKTTSSLHSESVRSGSGSINKAKKKTKRCGLCRDAICSQAWTL
ncbi:hypothetical protein K435DRAFT_871103 [Dendrothele bispora CBS 962.96]|uniref:Uncharacterized protein n=1 Tax=Dendrothele bispora (strain CBS 962.96) TaxID=1314807 RepID=A0A4S8L5D4_DENBC|nr:hypothetical protein K435DRAFT_871103 [Dendrothele bispora CBS 962.96]